MNWRMDGVIFLMGGGFMAVVVGVALQAPIVVIVGFAMLLLALVLTVF